jgi:hypothetical protein
MARLVLAIHDLATFKKDTDSENVDTRVKPAHDVTEIFLACSATTSTLDFCPRPYHSLVKEQDLNKG